MKYLFTLVSSTILISLSFIWQSCSTANANANDEVATSATLVRQDIENKFNEYWYSGEAEVNSYDLQQSRYGETRKGDAVLVFVTEDFSKSKQVKLDYAQNAGEDKTSVLKLNFLKKFKTGIYDYSMMQSVFSPINTEEKHALKTTTTSQDWCGHTFTQFNQSANKYQITEYSYFESEGDKNLEIEKVFLEDELMNWLRLQPSKIPNGNIKIVPSTFHTRLAHSELKPQSARIQIKKEEGFSSLVLEYLHFERTLEINFENDFPYKILSWQEDNGKGNVTTANLKKSIKSAYWNKNSNRFESLRDTLQLNY